MKKRIMAWLLAAMLALGMAASAESAPADGLYTVGLFSSASMFKVVDCLLRVEDGRMVAVLTMSGSGYGYLYQGTSAEAEAALKESWTPFTEDEQGRHVFAIEIPALDAEVAMAAWSIRYEKWYDRTLVFYSNTLREYDLLAPEGVYTGKLRSDTDWNGAMCMLRSSDDGMTLEVNGESMALPSLDKKVEIDGGWLILDSDSLEKYSILVDDGTYSVEVKTDSALLQFVDCVLTVKNGEMTARLTAKNGNFDAIYLGKAKDALKNEAAWIPAEVDAERRSVFEIRVSTLDNPICISTHSAKKRKWYDRTMTLDSDTILYLEQ